MTKNNKGNLFVFEVGPPKHSFRPLKMQFSTKKMGVNFFFEKMPNWGGGPRGVWQKTRLFPVFFFGTLPLVVVVDVVVVDLVASFLLTDAVWSEVWEAGGKTSGGCRVPIHSGQCDAVH